MTYQNEKNKEFTEKIIELERQNEKLIRKLQKRKGKPSAIIGLIFMSFGVVATVLSIWYEKMPTLSVLPPLPLMFIGLALVFWGSLLLYVRPNRYIRQDLLDASILSSIEALKQLIAGFEYVGQAVYLPPKFFNDLNIRIFISKKEVPPSVVKAPIKAIDAPTVFTGNNDGLFITPPGASLTRLFGDELGKDFDHISLNYLMEHLPKVLVDRLELTKNCDLTYEYESHIVIVRMKKVRYYNLCVRTSCESKICSTIGCPACSALICALTITTGKPVTLVSNIYNSKERSVSLRCKILEG
ncbi:hypothetical protein G4O51_04335 [Candidatus Bathyarchaeota archaeon A05DMB-2]|jgi:hypothetical protein|nr:hypothetical protein [Candidatus Bathyarchaeota archaeon A05DMB-2]